jgi:hypothetical protein
MGQYSGGPLASWVGTCIRKGAIFFFFPIFSADTGWLASTGGHRGRDVGALVGLVEDADSSTYKRIRDWDLQSTWIWERGHGRELELESRI